MSDGQVPAAGANLEQIVGDKISNFDLRLYTIRLIKTRLKQFV